jgi:hypothetical protein
LTSGRPAATRAEARLRATDLPLLLAAIATGGVAAPVLMLFGLGHVSAVVGSLLLNLEAPLTILLAVLVFGEHLGRRAATGVILIGLGAAILSSRREVADALRASLPDAEGGGGGEARGGARGGAGAGGGGRERARGRRKRSGSGTFPARSVRSADPREKSVRGRSAA